MRQKPTWNTGTVSTASGLGDPADASATSKSDSEVTFEHHLGADGTGGGKWLGRQWLLHLTAGAEATVEVNLSAGPATWSVLVREPGRRVQLHATVVGAGGRATVLEEGRGDSFGGRIPAECFEGSVKLRLHMSNRHSWLKPKTVEVQVRPLADFEDDWRRTLSSLSTVCDALPWVSTLVKRTFLKQKDVALRAFRLEVVEVQRIGNASLWESYARRRAEVAEELAALGPAQGALLSLTAKTDALVPVPCLAAANEHWLFHGTSPMGARAIASHVFRQPGATLAHGSAYGEGIYFSECSSKADLYATPESLDEDAPECANRKSCTAACCPPSCFKPAMRCCMLLCRVTLGRVNVVESMWPDKKKIASDLSTGAFHSVLGDRERLFNAYREFVVPDAAQVIPEFIIWYRRHNETPFHRWKRDNWGEEPLFNGWF